MRFIDGWPPAAGDCHAGAAWRRLALKLSPQQYQAILLRRDALQEQERKHLARRIHDEVSQTLTVLNLGLSLLAMDLPARKHRGLHQKLKELTDQLNGLCQSVRDIACELRPKALDELGLCPALEWYAKSLENQMSCEVACPSDPVVLAPSVAYELFTACRELIPGAFHPSRTSRVRIDVLSCARQLKLRLRGTEKPPRDSVVKRARSQALLSVRERLFRLGGGVSVRRDSGETVITLAVPSPAPARKEANSAHNLLSNPLWQES